MFRLERNDCREIAWAARAFAAGSYCFVLCVRTQINGRKWSKLVTAVLLHLHILLLLCALAAVVRERAMYVRTPTPPSSSLSSYLLLSLLREWSSDDETSGLAAFNDRRGPASRLEYIIAYCTAFECESFLLFDQPREKERGSLGLGARKSSQDHCAHVIR